MTPAACPCHGVVCSVASARGATVPSFSLCRGFTKTAKFVIGKIPFDPDPFLVDKNFPGKYHYPES